MHAPHVTPHSGIFSEKGASGSYWSEVSSKRSLSQLPLKLMVMPTGCPQVELPSPCHSCQDAEAASANLATLALQTAEGYSHAHSREHESESEAGTVMPLPGGPNVLLTQR